MKNKKLIFASLLALSGNCIADSNGLKQAVGGLSSNEGQTLEGLINQNESERIQNLSELVCERIEALSLEELQKLLDSGEYTNLLNESEEVTTSKKDQETCKQCLLALLSAKRQISLENSNTTPIQPILNEIPQIATENTAPAQATVEEQATVETDTIIAAPSNEKELNTEQPISQQAPPIMMIMVSDLDPLTNTLPVNPNTGLLDTSSIKPKEVNTALKEEVVQPKVENAEAVATEETIPLDITTTATQEETPKGEEVSLLEKDPKTDIEIPNYAGQQ